MRRGYRGTAHSLSASPALSQPARHAPRRLTCTMCCLMRRSRVPQKAVRGKAKGGAPAWRCVYSSKRVKSARISGCTRGGGGGRQAGGEMGRHLGAGLRRVAVEGWQSWLRGRQPYPK